jgi:hypothetical protein
MVTAKLSHQRGAYRVAKDLKDLGFGVSCHHI